MSDDLDNFDINNPGVRYWINDSPDNSSSENEIFLDSSRSTTPDPLVEPPPSIRCESANLPANCNNKHTTSTSFCSSTIHAVRFSCIASQHTVSLPCFREPTITAMGSNRVPTPAPLVARTPNTNIRPLMSLQTSAVVNIFLPDYGPGPTCSTTTAPPATIVVAPAPVAPAPVVAVVVAVVAVVAAGRSRKDHHAIMSANLDIDINNPGVRYWINDSPDNSSSENEIFLDSSRSTTPDPLVEVTFKVETSDEVLDFKVENVSLRQPVLEVVAKDTSCRNNVSDTVATMKDEEVLVFQIIQAFNLIPKPDEFGGIPEILKSLFPYMTVSVVNFQV
ncbi:unnamed protein product [Caenorhabditis brenneri]